MLSPEQIEAAGDAVAAVYNDIEAQMLDHLVSKLLSGDVLDQKSTTALSLLSQTHDRELNQILQKNKGAIDKAAYQAVSKAITASDKDDMKRAGGGSPLYPQQITSTVAGVAAILERDNIKMVQGAKDAFLSTSIEAITRVNTGSMTTERALHWAVRQLERKGIPIITYQNRKTGMVTVENKVDVAVRRHVRTQIAQDGARMTLERLQKMNIDLVEVSSHEDARPSHAEWQGRCYSLHGTQVIDGIKYPDFYEATRYGSVDGLLGANCRHSFGPYRHGAPRAYSPDPAHPSGLPGSEIYDLEQGQRALERDIRAAKRELSGAQQLFNYRQTPESASNLIDAKNALAQLQKEMREYIEEANAKAKPGTTILYRKPNREWAGDMPKISNADNLRKQAKADPNAPSKPMNQALYNSQVNYVKRNGGIVLQGGESVTKHLDSQGAAASMIPGNGTEKPVLMFRDNPKTSDVLEEVYHFKQDQRGDYSDLPDDERITRREIDAKEWLLSVSSRYNIPEDEVATTRKQLADEKAKLEEIRKRNGAGK
jgi:hypothetical protein